VDLWIGIVFVIVGAVAMMAFSAAAFAGTSGQGHYTDVLGVAEGVAAAAGHWAGGQVEQRVRGVIGAHVSQHVGDFLQWAGFEQIAGLVLVELFEHVCFELGRSAARPCSTFCRKLSDRRSPCCWATRRPQPGAS
jgi:hypothetical protein